MLTRIQDLLGLLFLAAFLVNFCLWIRQRQSGDLLYVPRSPGWRAVVYFLGLTGPTLFFAGKFLAQAPLAQLGLSMTNGGLLFMNVAAMVVRLRARRRV